MNKPKLDDYMPKARGDAMSTTHTMMALFTYCEDLEQYCAELEKTINKLCLILGNESFDSCYNCPFKDTVGNITKCIKKNEYDWTCTRENWKEWCMKDD